MDELKTIKTLLKQNEKIIRFGSAAVNLQSFDDKILQVYEEDKETVHELRISEAEFLVRFRDYKNETDETLVEITENGIKLCVKSKDVVSELNTDIRLGNVIEATTKWFLVDTDNFKLTKNSLTFTGEVNGLNCTVGGWSISGDKMDGSSLSSGTVNCSNLRLGNAIAGMIECNPDQISGKAVKLGGLKALDKDDKEESTTTVLGINSLGPIKATNGWNDQEHGCPYSVKYSYLNCRYIYLRGVSETYSTKNRLTCDYIEFWKAGTTWSDRRLKKNIVMLPEEKAESVMLAIEPVEFDIKKTGTHAAGYIAQDVKKAMEDVDLGGIVTEQNGYYGIRYDELITFRIAVIKRNQRKIEKLRGLRNGN